MLNNILARPQGPYLQALTNTLPPAGTLTDHSLPHLGIRDLLDLSPEELLGRLENLSLTPAVELAALLSEIATAQEYPRDVRAQKIEQLLPMFPARDGDAAILYLVRYHPDEFHNLMDVYADEASDSTRTSLSINRLIENNKWEIAEPLTKRIVAALEESGDYYKKRQRLRSLLKMINNQHLPDIATSVLSSFNSPNTIEETAKFFSLLTGKKNCQAFTSAWTNDAKFNSADYQQLVHSLVKCQCANGIRYSLPLNYLLRSKLDKKGYNEFIQLTKFFTDEIAYVLRHAPWNMRKNIAQHYLNKRQAAHKILALALLSEKELNTRIALVNTFTHNMNASQIHTFFSDFSFSRSHCHLFPYLFIDTRKKSDENTTCAQFVRYPKSHSHAQSRTKFLQSMSPTFHPDEQKVIHILADSGVLKRLLNEATFITEPDEFPVTFNDIKNDVEELLDGLEARRNNIERISYLKNVPPILFGFGLHDAAFKPTICRCFPYLTEIQRKAVIKTACAQNSIETVDALFAKGTHTAEIYSWMPKKFFDRYCHSHARAISGMLAEFMKRSQAYIEKLKPYMETPESSWEKPSEEVYAYLNEEYVHLANFFRSLETPSRCKLYKIAQSSTGQPEAAYKAAYEKALNAHKQFVSKDCGKLLNHLEKTFPDLAAACEEEEAFPEHFFAMLTTSVQNRLRLTNKQKTPLQTLAGVGICSASDLRLLGYNPEKENLLKTLRNYILDSIPREFPSGASDQTLANECEDIWEKKLFCNPVNESFPQDVDQFIAKTAILTRPRGLLQTKMKRLLADLEKLASLGEREIDLSKINEIKPQLHIESDEATFLRACHQCLSLAIYASRHHIIPTLSCYLKQPELELCWSNLHKQGFTSLKNLDEMGFIPNQSDLFEMNNLCSKLLPQ